MNWIHFYHTVPEISDPYSGAFKVNVKENADDYVVEAELPGVKKDSINFEYDNNYLTVSTKKEDKFEDKGQNYLRREIRSGALKRSFYVDNVDENKIDASFSNGVLKVILPKIEKGKVDSHKINIH